MPTTHPQIYLSVDQATPLWQTQRLQQQPPNLLTANLIPEAGYNLYRTYSQLLAQSIDRQLQSLLEAGR